MRHLLTFVCAVSLAFASPALAQLDEAGQGVSPLPFDPVPRAVLAQSPRKVIAHWHSFPLAYYANAPLDGYAAWLDPAGLKSEYLASGGFLRNRPLPLRRDGDRADQTAAYEDVRLAAEIGIDGFFVNCWYGPDDWRWQKELVALFDAAEAFNTRNSAGFSIAPNLDAAIIAMSLARNSDDALAQPERFADSLATLKDRVAFRKIGDAYAIGVFAIEALSPEWYGRLIARLQAAHGMKVQVTGVFLEPRKREAYAKIIQAYTRMDILPYPQVESEVLDRDWAHRHGMTFLAGVAQSYDLPQYAVTVESGGFQTEIASWKRAIDEKADAVHVITWNDHSEGTNLRPNTASQYAYYDIAAYYIAWFKTGTPPPIVRDVLYYSHRMQSTDARFDPSRQSKTLTSKNGVRLENKVHLLGFLKSRGEMQIVAGGTTFKSAVEPGIRMMSAPLSADDQPSFKLLSGGATLIDMQSAFRTRKSVVWQDLYYRAGSSSRPPVAGVQNNLPEDRWTR